MGVTGGALVAVTIGSGLLASAIGVAVSRRESSPISLSLGIMLFAVAAWALPYGVSLTCGTLDCVLFWQRLRYPGTVVAPVAYMVVALRYGGHDRWCTPRIYALLAIVPVVSVALVWTNPTHGLFWQSTDIARIAGVTVLDETVGPWQPVFLGYLYAVTVVTLGVLAATVVRSGPIYRKQALLMFLGGLVPLVTSVVTQLFSGSGPTVNLTTSAMAVTGLSFALALFRFDLLEVQPVARDQLVEVLDDGVIVAGPDDRIRDLNPVATELFPEAAHGQPIDQVIDPEAAPDGGELTVETDDGERVFRVQTTPILEDDSGGCIVHLRDITAVAHREQRISVLNRVLRHNIRNELNVVTGSLTALGERLPPAHEGQQELGRAREHTEKVVELADRARTLEQTLRQRDTRVAVPVAPLLRRVVAEARDGYPDAVIEVSLPEGLPDTEPGDDRDATTEGGSLRAVVITEELFRLALTELVENAVVHNDTATPRVDVRVATTGEAVHVRVADDGPGIPEMQRRVLAERTESPLRHGHGLGLWLVEWVASLSGGELSFRGDGTEEGTVAELILQREPATDG